MSEPADVVTADVDLAIGKRRLQTRISIPVLPMRPRELLSMAESLADLAANAACEDAAELGKPITCRAGCGACCRQLVPISHVEAHRVKDLLNSLPEPRQSEVLARFGAAADRLREAGMLDELRDPATWNTADPQPRGLDYFHLGIPCPFLENESCSIYEARPLVCREYLVVSDPALCADPRANDVQVLNLSFDTFRAMARTSNPDAGRDVRWVPLILAPEWAATHPEPPAAFPGPLLVRRLFSELTGKDIMPPPGPQEEPCPTPS